MQVVRLLNTRHRQKNDVAQLKTLAARVKNHPLGGYVELWEINAQAEQDLKKNKKLTAAVEKRYARFIEVGSMR